MDYGKIEVDGFRLWDTMVKSGRVTRVDKTGVRIME